MVWDIYFQISGLALIIVILFFIYSQKRLNFRAEKYFLCVLWTCLVNIVLDILCVVGTNFKQYIGSTVVGLIYDAYLVSLVLITCFAAWFAVEETRYSFKKVWVYSTILPTLVVVVICIMYDPVVCIDTVKGTFYLDGMPVIITSVMCFVHLLSTLGMSIVLRKNISKKRRYVVYSWLIIWLVAGAIQIIRPQIPVISFALGVACVFMYSKLENPEHHLDASTKIFNRKGFQDKVGEQLRFKKKNGIVSFYITNMNVINEIFGNRTVLKLTSEICDFVSARPDCIGFRLEDNLFSLFVKDRSDMEGVLEYVVERFEESWTINNVNIIVNVSVSYMDDISIYSSIEEIEENIHYFAIDGKKRPGEVVRVDETELGRKKKRIDTQLALEWALRNDGVEVYYQPIYNIKKGCFSVMEALVRIRDENGTLYFPGDFIEYAEKNGMILKLGEIIFRKVCEFIQRMHVEQYGIDFINVNLSVVQCMQEELSRDFKNIMGEYQIPPYRVMLEITETAAVATKRILDKNMQDLIDYGTAFALDDYGSGYSNLAYIVEMPVKIIKIDREITISYFKSTKARIATENTIKMIHDLGMEIIVEGIETEDEYMAFKLLGVEYIQGYYFSKPLPRDRVLNFITEWL